MSTSPPYFLRICLQQAGLLYPKSLSQSNSPACTAPAKSLPVMAEPAGLGPPVRIAFMFGVHGRSIRHIKRLFRMMYDEQHYYIFHVESRSTYARPPAAPRLRPLPKRIGDYFRCSATQPAFRCCVVPMPI